MNADDAAGVLAIWNDIGPGRESDFEHWFAAEHLAERLAVPGFRLGRRFEALAGSPRYFVYYLTDTPEVLTSPAYLARLDNPTPLTRTMMTEVFRNMTRALCRRVGMRGAFTGAVCVTTRFATLPERESLLPLLDRLAKQDGVARCELWASVENRPVTEEEKLRGGDRRIGGCLVVQTLRQADGERIAAELAKEFGARPEIGVYQLLCELASQNTAAPPA